MYKAYPAVFHAQEGGYWVEFPDLPGCVTEGNDITQVTAEAASALGGYLRSLIERDLPLPAPSDLHAVTAADDDFVSIVTADLFDA